MKIVTGAFVKFLGFAYKVTPFILYFYCYYPYFLNRSDCLYPFLDTLFSALKIYSGSTESGVQLNAAFEIARFLGVATTLSILVKSFNKLKDLLDYCKLINNGSVAVCGNSVYSEGVQHFRELRKAVLEGLSLKCVRKNCHNRFFQHWAEYSRPRSAYKYH